jgi:hypothetical protein
MFSTLSKGSDSHIAGSDCGVTTSNTDDRLAEVSITKSHSSEHRAVWGSVCALGYDSAAIVIHDTKLLQKILM